MTGATGFVGQALAALLPRHEALALSAPDWEARIRRTDFRDACVVHLAARVHDPRGRDERAFMDDNSMKTEVLARAASRGGATTFVFTSSIKVNGEETHGVSFRPQDVPCPEDAYGRSKWVAEQSLHAIARDGTMSIQIVRPTLVYGPRASGNLESLVRMCDTPWPLPFAAIANRRSWLAVGDLARLLLACAGRREPGVFTWLAASSETLATPRLIASIRDALGRPRRLLGLQPVALEAAAGAIGQGARMRRLTRSLEVDASDTEAAFGWKANVSIEAAIEDLVHAFRARTSR